MRTSAARTPGGQRAAMAEGRMTQYKGREARSQEGRRHARAEDGVKLRKDKRETQVRPQLAGGENAKRYQG